MFPAISKKALHHSPDYNASMPWRTLDGKGWAFPGQAVSSQNLFTIPVIETQDFLSILKCGFEEWVTPFFSVTIFWDSTHNTWIYVYISISFFWFVSTSHGFWFSLLLSGHSPWLSYSVAPKPRHRYHFQCRTRRDYDITLKATLFFTDWALGLYALTLQHCWLKFSLWPSQLP